MMSKLVAWVQSSDWHNWQHFKRLVSTVMADDACWLARLLSDAQMDEDYGCKYWSVFELLPISQSVHEMSEKREKSTIPPKHYCFQMSWFVWAVAKNQKYFTMATENSGVWLAGREHLISGNQTV